MERMKPLPLKNSKKRARERRVLMGLVELYLESGKPIGSKTLQESGFDDISSATIRNYFANLEEQGYLLQQHVSGGRVPTDLAFRDYASEHLSEGQVEEADEEALAVLGGETKEVAAYLHQAAELLSSLSGYACFLSTPRFDHDFVMEVKVVPIDASRCLAVIVTDFGSVLSEVMHTETELSEHTARRLEAYFAWRLTGADKPKEMPHKETALAQRLYNELMVRYITRYSSFTQEEVVRCGFSRLLAYPEYQSATALANGLALFESGATMADLLRECERRGEMTYWIGEQLRNHVPAAEHCTVIAVPYAIGGVAVGAVGLLGPTRLPYRRLFGLLQLFADMLGGTLTKSLYKFKIGFRQPEAGALYLQDQEQKMIGEQT
jgi:heat-inducible transcriptional repressor